MKAKKNNLNIITRIMVSGESRPILAECHKVPPKPIKSVCDTDILWSFYYNRKKFAIINNNLGETVEAVYLSNWSPERFLISKQISEDKYEVNYNTTSAIHLDSFAPDIEIKIVFDISKMIAYYG